MGEGAKNFEGLPKNLKPISGMRYTLAKIDEEFVIPLPLEFEFIPVFLERQQLASYNMWVMLLPRLCTY